MGVVAKSQQPLGLPNAKLRFDPGGIRVPVMSIPVKAEEIAKHCLRFACASLVIVWQSGHD
jgi:hypothetical protein